MSYQVWSILGGFIGVIIFWTCWACWAAFHYVETAVYVSPAQAIPELEAALATPLAELVAQAERKAIAEFSPLVGDPWEAKVRTFCFPVPDREAMNRAAERIEVTAFGDTVRSYIGVPPNAMGTTNTTHYAGSVRAELWGAGGGGSSGTSTITPTYGPHDPSGPALLADLRQRRHESCCHYALMSGKGNYRQARMTADYIAEIDTLIAGLLTNKDMW